MHRIHAADVLRNLNVIISRGGLMQILGTRRRPLGAIIQGGGARGNAGTMRRTSADYTTGQLTSADYTTGQLTTEGQSHTASIFRSSTTPRRTSLALDNTAAVSVGLSSHLDSPQSQLVTQDALTLLSLYLSAIIHDYDHRGVTNAFLIQDEDPLAVRVLLYLSTPTQWLLYTTPSPTN